MHRRKGDHVFIIVGWFVSGIRQNYSIDFHNIRWKGGTRAAEETVRFC